MLRTIVVALSLFVWIPASANTRRVPGQYSTIQSAIDDSGQGDVVLVSAGTYKERIKLKPGVTVRSVGDNFPDSGSKRSEATIIDGGTTGEGPGVLMAEGSTLDGFTITNVGRYDDAIWQKHYASQGEELGDDEGSVQAEGTVPAIAVRGVNCTVIHNVVHHNGDVGIAVIGREGKTVAPLIANNVSYRNLGGGIGVADFAAPIVRDNRCFENLRAGIGCRNSRPIILDNHCFANIRAGIGCREGARALMRGNTCYQNRRAGIGIRMPETSPVVEANECYENMMAGIGNRDGASPILRNNRCHHNEMAGIGSDGSEPLIIGNECRENKLAGIGIQGGATAIVINNQCIGNRLVAIGVTGESTATLRGNRFQRSGGMPPIVAIKDGSTAVVENNAIHGGGVAAILVQGTATVRNNRFDATGGKQGNAVWVWKDSEAIISDNQFQSYKVAVNASGSKLTVAHNTVEGCHDSAVITKANSGPVHIFGNRASSKNPNAEFAKIEGPAGVVADNVMTQMTQ